MAAQVFFGKIIERYSGDFILFCWTHGDLRGAERFGTPALDLDKYQDLTLPGDDIDLTKDASVIPLDDTVTRLGKIGGGQLLSLFSLCVFP